MAPAVMQVLLVIVLFVGLSSASLATIATRLQSPPSSQSPYRIILDGGSTGSRLHVYEFTHSPLTNQTSCHRRLSTKAEIPLSSFAPSSSSPTTSTSIAQHLLPLFHRAADVIPHRYHSTTHVHYQATAGMRLLAPEIQEQMYDELLDGLVEDDGFVFGDSLVRGRVGTLEGRLEAFHGAVAANYLEGRMDVTLRLVEEEYGGTNGPLGALDMGGASMQIVYLPDATNVGSANKDLSSSSANCENDGNTLCEEEFFSESYLSYGVDEFRERLWDQWIIDSQQRGDDRRTILNPCFFDGYTAEYNGYTLHGTGNTMECTAQIQRLLRNQLVMEYTSSDTGNTTSTTSTQSRRMVGGIQHPPIKGKFIAMSLFYFGLDSLRELSNSEDLSLSWPNPSIEELGTALDGLCSRKWFGDLDDIKHNAHTYTSASVLPHRCFESVYMVTLLRDGFGFLPQSRDITFTYLVNGSEVEWSLGMALALFAKEENPAVTIMRKEDFEDDGLEEEERNVTDGVAVVEEGEEEMDDGMVDLFSTLNIGLLS